MSAREHHMIEWIVIVSPDEEENLESRISLGLDCMVLDRGSVADIRTGPGFGFGYWKPEHPLRLETWSLFVDNHQWCFLDTVLYDRYGSHPLTEGYDTELAERFLSDFRKSRLSALRRLNGSFRGFVFDIQSKTLTTFVDRLATRQLFWVRDAGSLLVSTSFAGFRSLRRLTIDPLGAYQFLTIGFPVGERTLLDGVSMHLASTLSDFRNGSRTIALYWEPPVRTERPLSKCVETICESVEDHVMRIHGRYTGPIGLGLTGGRDSRVILSALAHEHLPFVPMSWVDRNFNDTAVKQLCALIGKRSIMFEAVSPGEMAGIQDDVFAYSHGYFLHSYGFSALAKQSQQHSAHCLMLGLHGDKLSGSSIIPKPEHVRNVSALAAHTLRLQMQRLTFSEASALLRDADGSRSDQTRAEWLESFASEAGRSYLSDVSLWQGVSNRSLKRIVLSMMPVRQYVQPIFPYLDSRVLDAYLQLPVKYIVHQKAHGYAAAHRVPAFGGIPATSSKLSLRSETRLPFLAYLPRLTVSMLGVATSWFGPPRYHGPWNQNHEAVYEEVRASPLFAQDRLEGLFSRRRITPATVFQMRTLHRFYKFYVCGDENGVPLRLRKRPPASEHRHQQGQ